MAKTTDINGYWVYENVPISRETVAPYRGRDIDSDGSMGLNPQKKYMVYRPAKEVCNQKTIDSFNGVPLVDEHSMLGEGQRDVGTRRIDGTVYNVHTSPKDPGVLYASLKVMSKAMQDLIQSGKRALSCGYYCDYRPEKGVFKGQPYEFVQYDLTGNHLALVKKGRMGEKCAIMDSADNDSLIESLNGIKLFSLVGRKESQVRSKGRKLSCDSACEINPQKVKYMPNENYDEMLAKALEGKGVKDKASIDKIIEFIGTLPSATANEPAKDADPTVAAPAVDPAATPVANEPVAAPEVAPVEAPVEPAKDADEAAVAPGENVEADPVAVAPAPTPVTKEEFQAAVDAAVAEKYAREDEGRQLAEDIAPKCGNLWKRGMDADDVAEVACEKLGHKDLPKEARIPFVKAMAAEAKKAPAGDKCCTACDSAFDATPHGKSSTMLKYLNK